MGTNCTPIHTQLEKNWAIGLRRERDVGAGQPAEGHSTIEADPDAFANLPENLSRACNARHATMRSRQQLHRTLFFVDVDDVVRDVVVTIGVC